MDKGEYAELQEQFEELQRQYDELRIVVARAGIPLPDEERKRPALTLIKGGLAAIVGLLGFLLGAARRRPVISGVLVASITGLGVVAGIPMSPPSLSPRTTLTSPSHRMHRRRPARGISHTPSTRRSVRPVSVSRPVAVANHRATPAPSLTLPHSQPQPQPSPPAPTPVPSPVPTPRPAPHGHGHHSRHCLVYAVFLGQRVCVKFGIGVP